MHASRSRSLTTGAVATLALAGSAALVLSVGDAIGIRSARAEALSIAAWLLGWTFLIWATVLGGICAVQLVRRLASRRSSARSEVLLLVASAAVIVAVIRTHPLWGSGAGHG